MGRTKRFLGHKMISCRYGTKCTRADCRFDHSFARDIDVVPITVEPKVRPNSLVIEVDGDVVPRAKSPNNSAWETCVDFLLYIRERTAAFPPTRNPVDDQK